LAIGGGIDICICQGLKVWLQKILAFGAVLQITKHFFCLEEKLNFLKRSTWTTTSSTERWSKKATEKEFKQFAEKVRNFYFIM
jgi:hypothetical protein